MITKLIKINHILKDAKRIDGKFFLNNDALLSLVVEENQEKCLPLSYYANVFNPPVFKRLFCQNTETAVPYFQSSDVPVSSEKSKAFINKAQAKKVNAIVKENQILITGFGTIGNVRLVSSIQNGVAYANNTCRVEVNENNEYGFIYASLASRYSRAQMNKNASGSVVRYIEAPGIKKTLIPKLHSELQKQIHNLITKSAELRVKAERLMEEAESNLKKNAGLNKLHSDDYDYFGPRSNNRKVSCFSKNISNIGTTSINAFNHSNRIAKTIQEVKDKCKTLALTDVLDENKLFTTGSFPRIEVNSGKGIMLINQSDIFDTIIKGKRISKRKVKVDNLVQYGEVLIAGVGTLGESEFFCKVVFANEDIQGQLVSGEFVRMKTNEEIPSGYLYVWLNTDYGFRLIRSTQSGTKQCRPIHRLLLDIPVPILDKDIMKKIHEMVTKAHTMRYEANLKELQAIQLVEKEIEQWQQ